MIEIICDKCDRSFAVEDSNAGSKVPCPMCGDINRVPNEPPGESRNKEHAERDSGRDSGGDSGGDASPQGKPAPAGGSEKEIRVVRPAMLRAHPFRFLVILALVIGGVVGAVLAWNPEKPFLTYGSLVLTLIGLAWFTKWWIAAYLWIKITITNKRTIRHEGIVRRHSTEVMHDHVRSVDINQNFVQRVCKVGYIGIDSAGQDGIEIEIRDIPDPYGIKALIDRYRKM